MSIDSWGVLILAVACAGQLLFVLMYSRLYWFRTFLGRVLFCKAAALLVFLTVLALGGIFDFPFEGPLALSTYVLVALGTWSQVFAFRRRGREEIEDGS